jgi:hypothetical protein
MTSAHTTLARIARVDIIIAPLHLAHMCLSFFVLLFIHSSYTHHLLTGYGPVARLPCVLSLYCSSVVVLFVVPFVVTLVPSKTFSVSP